MPRPFLAALALALLTACSGHGPEVARETRAPDSTLHTGETPEMRGLVNSFAAEYGMPPALIHRVIQRESGYNPAARNGPYYGLMQILPETARGMGYDGPIEGLLDAGTNLRYGGAYLRGAWLLSGGDMDGAVRRYASGYYYEARDRCMLVATGLRNREIAPGCR
ncbi:MAG: lytic transglycosylase domain-containing protein [Rubellimicrobium sp.]|nr:lytic transglycosylase domain-containing protein [Rubellimicrobium sp.]